MGAKVLVVDDSRAIRQQVGSALAQAGYDILEAEDGLQGLNTIGAQRDISIVICDVNMPNMNGLEMLAKVKADPSNATLPVLMLTTEGKADLIQQAKRSGAKGWIVKPFKVDQLVAAVRKIVG
ncbi:MAG TPA: response regulator [Polyangia bacterium]|nr:response regulator [Polyangia bacterium]